MAVLRDLLRYAAQLPTLFRDISTNHLPGLLTSLLGLRPEVRALIALTLRGARAGVSGGGGSGQWGGSGGSGGVQMGCGWARRALWPGLTFCSAHSVSSPRWRG